MKLTPRKDAIVDAMLREWGRWRRVDMGSAGAPRKHAQGSSWQSLVDTGDGLFYCGPVKEL